MVHRTLAGLSDHAVVEIPIYTVARAGAVASIRSGSLYSFRVTITGLIEQGVSLEDAQRLAGHADPRTTRLYDRRDKKITRNIVERSSI
jgi:site-specific recombinase XerD